ncbi:MAG: hypothetical protein NDI90_00960 [Nitrospira sp. BO4]|nr:hypothetical protein [Nitrospira sp. BO4]
MTPSIGALTISGSLATILAGANVDMGTGMIMAPTIVPVSSQVVVRLSLHCQREL